MPAHIGQLPAGPALQTGVIAFSPASGVLVIVLGRVKASYRVEEFAAEGGRGFRLVKLAGGSDPEERDYSVFCAKGRPPECPCKGYVRWGSCKHARALAVCLAKKWL